MTAARRRPYSPPASDKALLGPRLSRKGLRTSGKETFEFLANR